MILAAWAATACAQEAASQESLSDGSWSFRLAPYVWFAGIHGDIDVNHNLPVHVDVGFDEIFDHIDWLPPPIMLAAEARYQRFAIVSDFLFLGVDALGSRTRGPVSVAADIEQDSIVAHLAGTFRVVEEPGVTVDLLAGGRLWSVDASGVLHGPLAVRQRSGDKIWVDPIVGVIGRIDFGSGFGLRIEGDVGGFGVASDSDWQVNGALQYAVSDGTRLEAGYRYLSVDYRDGGFLYDTALSGPIVSVSFRL